MKNWGIIREGMSSRWIWHKIKMKLALEDENSRKVAADWGQVFSSDLYIYDDINFKTVIGADGGFEEDKIIYVDKNTTDQTVKVTINDNSGE